MSGFTWTTQLVYVLAASGFVLGLHLMNNPATARRGNQVSIGGMVAAIAVTLAIVIHSGAITATGWAVMIAGALVGSAVGLYSARTVQMTAMPQLVSVFNAVGGGAAALVGIHDYIRLSSGHIAVATTVTTLLDVLIGAVTFSGSIIAAGKLQGVITSAPVTFPGARVVNLLLAVVALGTGGYMIASYSQLGLIIVIIAALAFGVSMVMPIGGADMPVVISLLNAFTGTAVAMAGFVIQNWALIIAGALVGASGGILTKLMADAMNRSIRNIIVGGFGTGDSAPVAVGATGSVKSVAADDAAIQLAYASKVIIVPGYGLAAAQAQHEVASLADLLESRGVDVSYAIHPVAGRMPGHMNVLLAEANVPYPAAQGDGRDQPRVRADRRRPGHRRQRRHQPGRAPRGHRDLGHAHSRCRPGQEHHRHQAVHGPRLRGHRQRAVHRPQDEHVLRRRQDGARGPGQRGQDPGWLTGVEDETVCPCAMTGGVR